MSSGTTAPKKASLGGALAGVALELAPNLAAVAAFVAGATMVASAATPGVAERLRAVTTVAPIFVIEFSHFVASLIGLLLMLLGSGLWGRRQGAFWAAFGLLIAGAVFSLTKGLEYEEAVLLAAFAGLLFAARKAFDRPSRMFTARVGGVWIAAAVIAVISAGVLGLVAYDDVSYSDELWWTFVTNGDISRSLRAGMAVAVLAFVASIWSLFSTPVPRPRRPGSADLDKAQAILEADPNAPAEARLWLTGDKDLLFSASGEAVLAYRIRRRSWIALGGAAGRTDELRALMWRFVELADRAGGKAIFYGVRGDLLPALAAMGFIMRQVGEDAVVLTENFALTGKARQNLRTACNRAESEGCVVEVLPPGSATNLAAELKAVSDAWLHEHQGAEKAFSMGFFDVGYLNRDRLAVVRREGRIVAFANVQCGLGGREAGIDLMRYHPDAPHGVMDFLFVRLIQWAKAEGIAEFNLGMAPLSGLENRRLAPLFARLGALVFAEGGALYGFQGLHAYKAKFSPDWRPVYMAGRPGASLTLALLDAALLTSGGWRGAFLRG